MLTADRAQQQAEERALPAVRAKSSNRRHYRQACGGAPDGACEGAAAAATDQRATGAAAERCWQHERNTGSWCAPPAVRDTPDLHAVEPGGQQRDQGRAHHHIMRWGPCQHPHPLLQASLMCMPHACVDTHQHAHSPTSTRPAIGDDAKLLLLQHEPLRSMHAASWGIERSSDEGNCGWHAACNFTIGGEPTHSARCVHRVHQAQSLLYTTTWKAQAGPPRVHCTAPAWQILQKRVAYTAAAAGVHQQSRHAHFPPRTCTKKPCCPERQPLQQPTVGMQGKEYTHHATGVTSTTTDQHRA